MNDVDITFPFTPVIVVGTGRSGTNMLRDALCVLPGFDTWPCDEGNYIWRHGNRDCRPSRCADHAARLAGCRAWPIFW